MPRTELNLKELLALPLWEKLQDQLAAFTGVSVMCIDFKGRSVTRHSRQTAFCAAIRAERAAEKRCCRCGAMAALEAVRQGRPNICLYHCGVTSAAVPIMSGERFLGAVIIGQVRLPEEDAGRVRQLVHYDRPADPDDSGELAELYEQLPVMSLEKLEATALFVRSIVDYTVERYLKESGISDARETPEEPGASLSAESQTGFPVSILSPVYPAVEYVHEHITETISMSTMAKLCHLSSSYFSRIFSREAGESFVSYVNRSKVELAKQMLLESNRSVSQIAQDVGFHDTSHFISLFKRFEGLTPTSYRQFKRR